MDGALRSTASGIGDHRNAATDLRSLVRQLNAQLHTVLEFTFLDLVLYDRETGS
jgi:hypothetical protein